MDEPPSPPKLKRQHKHKKHFTSSESEASIEDSSEESIDEEPPAPIRRGYSGAKTQSRQSMSYLTQPEPLRFRFT